MGYIHNICQLGWPKTAVIIPTATVVFDCRNTNLPALLDCGGATVEVEVTVRSLEEEEEGEEEEAEDEGISFGGRP